jgi:hypothetical protein
LPLTVGKYSGRHIVTVGLLFGMFADGGLQHWETIFALAFVVMLL